MGSSNSDGRSRPAPRDLPAPDGHLGFILKQYNIAACRVLNIGCGRAESLIWLAKQGYTCDGVDISRTTLRFAREAAAEAGVVCRFLTGTFPEEFGPEVLPENGYGLIFDYGVLNYVTNQTQQRKFLRGVSALLRPGGIYYSLIARKEGSALPSGSPRWTFSQVRKTVTMVFRLALLKPVPLSGNEASGGASWLCVVKKPARRSAITALESLIRGLASRLRSR